MVNLLLNLVVLRSVVTVSWSLRTFKKDGCDSAGTEVTRDCSALTTSALGTDVPIERDTSAALPVLASCLIYAPKWASAVFVDSRCPFRCLFGCVLLLYHF